MTTTPLPPLPEPEGERFVDLTPSVYAMWERQMKAYAFAARADLEAENQRLREALRNLLNDTQHARYSAQSDWKEPAMSELEQFKRWAASVDMPDAVLPRAWMAWQASADRAQPAQAEAVPPDVVRDAERYRMIRKLVYIDPLRNILRIAQTYLLRKDGPTVAEQLDAAIDAAIAQQKGGV